MDSPALNANRSAEVEKVGVFSQDSIHVLSPEVLRQGAAGDFSVTRQIETDAAEGLERDFLGGKESACQCRKLRFDPLGQKDPWSRKWQPTPVFFPGKSHGHRSLGGCSPWCCTVRHD